MVRNPKGVQPNPGNITDWTRKRPALFQPEA
jgi:hypothetical protein